MTGKQLEQPDAHVLLGAHGVFDICALSTSLFSWALLCDQRCERKIKWATRTSGSGDGQDTKQVPEIKQVEA